MNIGRYFLVDTSAWIESLRTGGTPEIRTLVGELTANDSAVLCDQVRLELWNGARSGADRRVLRNLENLVRTVPTLPEVWDLARDYARKAREGGLTIPASDLVIAACAHFHGLGLVHRDNHFEQLATIVGEPA